MNCEQAQHLFDAYLSDTLGGSLATEFGAHRLSCNRCRRDLALLEVAGHVIATDSEAPLVGKEFTDRLVQCAVDRPAKRTLHFPKAVMVGLPTVLAACIGLIVWVGGDNAAVTPSGDASLPRVLGDSDTVEDREELLKNVKTALSLDPDNVALREFAERLRSKSEEIIGVTHDGASLLEDYGKDAIKELLRSVPSGSKDEGGSKDEATPANEDGSADMPSDAQGAGSPTEEL